MNRKAAECRRTAAGCVAEVVGQPQFQLDTCIHLQPSHERVVLVLGVLGGQRCSWHPARHALPDTLLCVQACS